MKTMLGVDWGLGRRSASRVGSAPEIVRVLRTATRISRGRTCFMGVDRRTSRGDRPIRKSPAPSPGARYGVGAPVFQPARRAEREVGVGVRSEEHTSELQ